MARRKKFDRPTSLEIQLPTSIKSALEAALFSEPHGKIPFGAFSELGTELFTNWLRDRGYKL